MTTVGFRARQLAKALTFLTALTACQSGSRPPSSEQAGLRVASVSTAMPDPSSSDAGRFPGLCESWALTPEQVETFFALSTEMDSRAYHHEYDTAPCMIEGELVDGGREWAFHINGAAKGYWSDGSNTHYFGCTAAACDSLVLVPHIGMDP